MPTVAVERRHDPLTYALLAAVAIHALILLGTGFQQAREPHVTPDRLLEIMLVRPKAPKAEPPKDAAALAQVSQAGGGTKQGPSLLTPSGPPPLPVPEPVDPRLRETPAPHPATEILAIPGRQSEAQPVPQEPPREGRRRTDLGSLLASTQLEIDRLTAEIDRRSQSPSGSARRRSINASTKEYRFAAYLEAWREKVERVGNLNYPDEAKRRKLYGDLILHVSVRSDGSVENVRVVRSSGQKVLDDAAVRIVRLASPYAPFPPDIRKDTDVLEITRTWQFTSGERVYAGR
jgi:protein TonB